MSQRTEAPPRSTGGGGADLEGEIEALARRARAASRKLARLSGAAKIRALEAMAAEIEAREAPLVAANRRDLEAAREAGLPAAMLERLRLDEPRVRALARAIREIASQPDPVGEVSELQVRPNGLRVGRMRVPLGVVMMIYESRPNVTSDAAALGLLSGNAVILRGGKEAFHSNRAIVEALRAALEHAEVTPDAVQLVETTDRAAVGLLLRQEAHIDLVIPRGGEALIRAVVEQSRIPVLQHYKGVCHVYLDESADPETAASIVVDSKAQRPSVCNSLETLLVHRDAAGELLPSVAARLREAGVELRGCARSRDVLGDGVAPAAEEDWAAEYLDLILAVRVVDEMEEAIDHIARWGSKHTEAIVTRDYARAQEFLAAVDSSTVLVNASTRFADGGELGLGAEIGISTSKLHAFGPMGARELTASKFVVYGAGQTRG